MNKSVTRYFLWVMLPALLITGCVSNKKITYLQYEDELSKPETIVTDSIIRKYESGELRYKIQRGDLLSIKIASITPEDYNPFSQADRMMSAGGNINMGGSKTAGNYGYRVDPWGVLELPVIGKLTVEGMHLEELEDTINSLAKIELEDPLTRVNLLNYRFTIMGEVGGDGTFNSDERTLTMTEAISMAGPSEFADLSRVKVIRTFGDDKYVFYVNLLDESFITSEFYFVHPNDLIIVSPLYTREFLKYVVPNISLIASSVSLVVSLITLFSIR